MKFNYEILKEYSNQSEARVIIFFENDTKNYIEEGIENDILEKISYLVKSGEFKGEKGKIEVIKRYKDGNPKNIILLGLGKEAELTSEVLRNNIAKVIKKLNEIKAKSLEISIDRISNRIILEDVACIIAETCVMCEYKFDKYISDKKEFFLQEVTMLSNSENKKEDIVNATSRGIVLGESNIIARRLVNEPANILTPVKLANEVNELGKSYRFDVNIYDEKAIEELDMRAYLEVAKASENPPRLIVMKYYGDKDNEKEIIGLVGKGLTYDSGGLSIKPTAGMVTMKSDMGGAAAVIGTMTAIARLKLKVNVVAVVAACENMISGRGYKPGDIIGSMEGKTIEVLNTDAEGRLTLADAVTYIIKKENATKVIDIATLTGAVLSALGTKVTGVVTNNDELYEKLEASSKICGEKVWKLPTFEEYKELIKSDVADLKNIGGPNAGTITAGLFIGEFVSDMPWMHLDIAGTSWTEKPYEYQSKGGTGEGARLLYHLVENIKK